MNKILISILFLTVGLWAIDVPIDEVEKRVFSETISVNSKIIQLSSSKSLVMAGKGGKITKYLVKEGDKIKKGQAVARVSVITPIELSINIRPLKAELKTLKKRLRIAKKNYNMVKKLYNIGLESEQNLNIQEEEKLAISSEIEIIKAKISTLELPKKSSKNSYTLYAGGFGTVEKILVASHGIVDSNTALLSIVQGKESFLVKSYVPLQYVNKIKLGLKGKMLYGGKMYEMHITQILPALDEKTQQMQVISTLDKPVANLLVNAYVRSELSIGTPKSYLAVKKSALSFFNNEWVVFVPKEHDEEEEHKEEHHDEHQNHNAKKEHADHDEKEEHENHEEHEGHNEKEEHKGHGHDEAEEEVPYEIKVIKIIQQNEQFVAIEGIEEHEHYVSDKSYYVKSLLLKSSLGGHGH